MTETSNCYEVRVPRGCLSNENLSTLTEVGKLVAKQVVGYLCIRIGHSRIFRSVRIGENGNQQESTNLLQEWCCSYRLTGESRSHQVKMLERIKAHLLVQGNDLEYLAQ